MTSSFVEVPIRIIDGEPWLSFVTIASKAKLRAIGMDHKPKRVQDEGKHHCFEINAEGNIRMKLKSWSFQSSS